ncbi:DUF2621 family protein [Tumebacillus flagellatus]|uniref:Uncharacterized protein n=1 Tax=Tumebacillus flagellatus TaxID=1157490 RepID=A0A074LKF6_9BACL|nr:DUF2621 family protein [Tumebacillus flagellatus]KEO81070.1 hypothetical protein EL26_22800 [Tumebacillus flagellatus]
MKFEANAKSLLDELMAPFPFLMRAMAKKMIEGKIAEEAKKAGHAEANIDDVVRGYIIVGLSRGNDAEKIKNSLVGKIDDVSKYDELFA